MSGGELTYHRHHGGYTVRQRGAIVATVTNPARGVWWLHPMANVDGKLVATAERSRHRSLRGAVAAMAEQLTEGATR